MRRLFLLVAAVVLVDTSFFAAVSPLLPEYSDEFDLSKTGAGVLAAAYPAGTFAAAVPSGWLAARWGVKPTLLLGLGLLGVTSLVFAFANHIVLLDAARFTQGVGGACMWAAGMAWLVIGRPARAARRADRLGARGRDRRRAARAGARRRRDRRRAGDRVQRASPWAPPALAGFAWAPPASSPSRARCSRSSPAALRRPAVLAGFWLFTLPALFAGVIEVLGPLRLDDLGASGAAIGAIFLITAAAEAVISPIAGRLSDRRGRLTPIRAGLTGALVMAVLLPLPGTVVLLGVAILFAFASLGGFWAPAMALLSDASEESGLDQALAFSISNLAWAVGHVVGAGAGGAVAEVTLRRGALRGARRDHRSDARDRDRHGSPAARAGLNSSSPPSDGTSTPSWWCAPSSVSRPSAADASRPPTTYGQRVTTGRSRKCSSQARSTFIAWSKESESAADRRVRGPERAEPARERLVEGGVEPARAAARAAPRA